MLGLRQWPEEAPCLRWICHHHPLSFIQSQVIDHLHLDTVSGARKSQRPVVGQGPTAIVGVGGN